MSGLQSNLHYGFISLNSFSLTGNSNVMSSLAVSRASRFRCRSHSYLSSVKMAVSISSETKLPDSQVGLTITADSDETTQVLDKIMKEFSKKATVPGFRKGKVPKQVLLSHIGKRNVYGSACEELFNISVGKALKESNVNFIGQAELDVDDVEKLIAEFHPGSPFSFGIKIDVWPETEIVGEYKGLEIEAEEEPFDERLIDEALVELQKKHSSTMLAGDGSVAELGKVLVASMSGYYAKEDGSKGEALPEIADGKSIEITMEHGLYMSGFVEGLVGVKVGDVKLVPVEFAANAPRAELRGVKALFEVSVEAIKDRILPDLDDEFAKLVSDEDTMDGLRSTIRARMDEESRKVTQNNVQKAIESQLMQIVQVQVPKTLIEERLQNKFATMMADFKGQGMDDAQVKAMITPENFEKYAKSARPNVVKQLRLSFAYSKIAEMEDLKANEQEIEDQIVIVKGELKGEEVDEDKLRETVEAEVTREKVLEFLKQNSNVKLIPKQKQVEEEEEAQLVSS